MTDRDVVRVRLVLKGLYLLEREELPKSDSYGGLVLARLRWCEAYLIQDGAPR
jgi:hypothetical protein